jgi:hypothetical protein
MAWDTPAARRGRSAWRALAVLLAVVAAAILAAGGGGEPTQARDPEVLEVATAGGARRALPSAPGTTATAPLSAPSPGSGPTGAPAGPGVVPGADGLRVVALTQNGPGQGTLQTVDLGSGERHEQDVMVVTRGAPGVAPMGDGQLAVVDGRRVTRMPPGLDGSTELSDDRAFAVYPSPPGGRVWTVGDAPGLSVRLLASDGSEQFRRALPGYTEVAGTVGDRLLLAAGGTLSMLSADGSLTTIAQGEFLAAANGRIAVLRCAPNALECEVAVLDAAGRTERSRPAPAGQPALRGFVADGFGVAQLSPDGRYLATIDFTSPSGVRVLDLERGGALDLPDELRPSNFGTMAWAPGGRALALGTPEAIQWFDLASGEVTFIEVEGNVVEILVLPAG